MRAALKSESAKRWIHAMKFTKVMLALVCLMSGALVAQQAKVTELMSKDVTACPAKRV